VRSEEVLKLIDEMSEVLSVLIELRKNGRFREAIEKIDDAMQKYFKCDDDFMYSVSEDFLVDALKRDKGLTSEQLASLADILTEKGDILLEQNNLKESKKILRNSLKIYFFLNEDQDFFSFKNMNKMVLINEKLSKINVKVEN